ncbi:MAG: nuclear transport factor 2 family protein [Candidatus Binataceae bacterium]
MKSQVEDLVLRFQPPWNAHDVDGIMRLMTGDCVWEFTGGPEPAGRVFKGAAAVREAIASRFATVPDIRYEFIRQYPADSHSTVELTVSGSDPKSGKFRYQVCDILEIRDDRISVKRSYRKSMA